MKIARRLQHVKRSEIRSIFETAPADAINLGLGEIHFPTPDLILDAGHKVLEGKYINYTPNAGLPELCQTIARYYDNRIPRNNICVTNGTEEALFAAVQALVDPGDEVLLADPCFVAYETVVRLAGGIPVFFDLQSNMNFSIDRDSLQKALSPRTKLILLCNPSNPLSICFTSSEIDFLVKISTENSLYLLVDEIYRDLYYD
ncbi:MAG: aminotransferase class I/II-fold pyridoxal phosphate-dependent enzyme, partial [Candidatus Cloacimonetes bacterium]|nr:aminotransferase class I/II-fold pyridoxal phosphate-dependent enzyme [Candidatus Cloacimonadota bacterium]